MHIDHIIPRLLPRSRGIFSFGTLLCASSLFAQIPNSDISPDRNASYTPTSEILEAQEDFESDRFGIFIHWGIYSLFGQGEWYLNYGLSQKEYAKAAGAFYPAGFDAGEWADAFKDAGAGYVCFTTRHHDGFSMWNTQQSDYNIVTATPFRRDILKELSDSLASRDLSLHLYYSHLDWGRDDYPKGRTGRQTGVDTTRADWNSYYSFMNAQLKELLTGYGPIRAVWFDGWWDHDEDAEPFRWNLPEQYAMIHEIQPGCLIANNHHMTPFPGENIQIFERDLPGENSAGLSGQEISRLPLETCNTMNGMWGYKVADQDYKDSSTLIRYLVKASGMGANLLLNIGPQPDGRLPEAALQRLHEMGDWMRNYSTTIKGTKGSPLADTPWGTATIRDKELYLHILNPGMTEIILPSDLKIRKIAAFDDGKPIKYKKTPQGFKLSLPPMPDIPDYILIVFLR